MYLSMGSMEPYIEIVMCAELYVTIVISYPEFEICTVHYEPPESILCIYMFVNMNIFHVEKQVQMNGKYIEFNDEITMKKKPDSEPGFRRLL